MPRRKAKEEKEDNSSSEEEEKEEDVIYLTPAPKSMTKYIHDGRKKNKYVFKRWTYGDQLEILNESLSIRGKTKETNMIIFNAGMIEKTVKEPKMTRREVLDLDPVLGSVLYSYSEQINYPNLDFQDILAKLLESR